MGFNYCCQLDNSHFAQWGTGLEIFFPGKRDNPTKLELGYSYVLCSFSDLAVSL
jgi:hypothetical protein